MPETVRSVALLVVLLSNVVYVARTFYVCMYIQMCVSSGVFTLYVFYFLYTQSLFVFVILFVLLLHACVVALYLTTVTDNNNKLHANKAN